MPLIMSNATRCMLFPWDWRLQPVPCRAQPPLAECSAAQHQAWGLLPVLSQLPQQPDPCPGRDRSRPTPSPQHSTQRCHPELQPGRCPLLPCTIPKLHPKSCRGTLRKENCLPSNACLFVLLLRHLAGLNYCCHFHTSKEAWLSR